MAHAKWLNFGDYLDHRPDPGVRNPKSGFTGLSKKYLVDSGQICIANLHCKNHSAILLCWRLAKVCTLWVLLVVHFFLFSLYFSSWISLVTERSPLNVNSMWTDYWWHGDGDMVTYRAVEFCVVLCLSFSFFFIIIINEIYIAQVRKSQCN